MTPDLLFSSANAVAILGWVILAGAIVLNQPFWRDQIAGRVVPAALAGLYLLIILAFWWRAEGGFGALGDVQKLFTTPWIALAGWVHYLAFDLAIGAIISRQFMERGLPRLLLVPVLPLTFMFGPIGFLLGQAILMASTVSRPPQGVLQ